MLGKRLLSLSLPLVIGATALLAMPAAHADVVPLAATPQDEIITTTIVFNVTHPDKLANYIRETVTPGSPHYRDFLTLQEFVVHYAPHQGQIMKTERYLEGFGITIDKVFADNLAMTVSGPASAFDQAFGAQLRDFEETQPNLHPNRRAHFHRPTKQPQIPALLTENGVMAIVGLSNEYMAAPMHVADTMKRVGDSAAEPQGGLALNLTAGSNRAPTGIPSRLTTADVANIYNFSPLYEEGISGAGTTMGVATYATFQPSDAYLYWEYFGLPFKPDRISQVHVDGGGGTNGSDETTLDVEQSGGLAPNADIVVYDAPNSSQGGVDMFYQIVSENRVDSLSYSWGLPEMFYFADMNGGIDFTSELQTLNQAFMEAAVQGMTLFAASGDSGAYDTNRSFPAPYFSTPLTVDSPASSPYMTAAGGTTLAYTFDLGCGPSSVNAERAWGWDYLADYLVQKCGVPEADAVSETFALGAGGGVSVYWQRPWYQAPMAGMQNSMPDQSFVQFLTAAQAGPYDVCSTSAAPPYDCMDLAAGFAGRNVPDISMNADPYSGYYLVLNDLLYYQGGGTSFVAPQLNGATALINQRVGGRIGLLNAQLYGLLRADGYGPNSPFNDITHGDNWYWQGVPGYDPATGVGTPNVARLAEALAAFSSH